MARTHKRTIPDEPVRQPLPEWTDEMKTLFRQFNQAWDKLIAEQIRRQPVVDFAAYKEGRSRLQEVA